MIDGGAQPEIRIKRPATQQKHREQMQGWRRASPAAAVFRVCQRLYVARGETLVAAFWQIRRDGASIRARLLVS